MPDFGSFRGFGEKLVQGQTPTQLGLIGSFGAYDADAVAFFNRVTTAGGTLSVTEKDATNQLVLDLKANGTWTAMKAIYPMVGASAAACSRNLKSDNFNGTFNGGWTFSSTGVTPNGTNAFFDSNFNQSLNLTPSNNHISIYSRTDFNSLGGLNIKVDCGVTNNVSFAFTEILSRDLTFASFANGSQTPRVVVANSLGQFIGVGNVSNSIIYKNGVNLQTNSNAQTRAMFNSTIYFGATHDAIADVGRYFSPRQNAFSSIGDSLTDSESFNFYTAVQAFQTTLSRNV
jgi:hypothetical protein